MVLTLALCWLIFTGHRAVFILTWDMQNGMIWQAGPSLLTLLLKKLDNPLTLYELTNNTQGTKNIPYMGKQFGN